MIFSYIEDYIEFISGYRDINGRYGNLLRGINVSMGVGPGMPVLSMSKIDASFISSINSQIAASSALTEKQFSLAMKLIAKYKRQLSELGVEQPNHSNLRLGLRIVSYAKTLALVKNKLALRFRYNYELLTTIKKFAKDSSGSVEFNFDNKIWEFGLTEYNLSWVTQLAILNEFEISKEVLELNQLILDVEKQGKYEISLKIDENGKYYISNAPQSMLDYINETCGFNDLLTLADISGILGFDISDEVATELNKLSQNFSYLCSSRNASIGAQDADLTEVIEWATKVKRLPILVYDSQNKKMRRMGLQRLVNYDEFLRYNETLADPIPDNIKIIYTDTLTSKLMKKMNESIPVFLTYTSRVFTTPWVDTWSKQVWAARTQKIICISEKIKKVE